MLKNSWHTTHDSHTTAGLSQAGDVGDGKTLLASWFPGKDTRND